MIETAIELTGGRVTSAEIQQILDLGREMLSHPVELLDGVRETIGRLHSAYDLMLITKGDLLDEESKIARSGIDDMFTRVEVVSEKDMPTYRGILGRHGIEPARFRMVGNSVRSDILPVIEIGARAILVPYHTSWVLDAVELRPDQAGAFPVLERISDLPEWLFRQASHWS